MRRASYIRHEKLPDLMGRINYISSGEEQEHLYAVYQTQPEEYWRELAKENRDSFFRSGTRGTCIEAREFIIALPEAYYKNGWDPDKVLHHFVESFRKEYGAECIAALHHNHDMNNYHIHLIYSEREKLDEPVIKIAIRNMYFDPDGRHLRTKKEATVDGELMPGYTMVHKGEVYEQHLFDKKSPVFKQKNFTAQVKRFFTDLMNQPLRDDQKLQVFPKNSPYLATKKIGKNNPKAYEIRRTNDLRRQWNAQVDHALKRGAPPESLLTVKSELITKPVAESIKQSSGRKDPDKYDSVIIKAVLIITEMCRSLSKYGHETWAEVWGVTLMIFMDYCTERITGSTLSQMQNHQRER